MSDSNLQNSTNIPLVAVVGRPNVGKSTLFNRLVGSRRAITDPTPGVTRDPVEADWDARGRRIRLIDTGGVKLDAHDFDEIVAQKSRSVIRKADCILLLLDAMEITPEDEELIAFLRPYVSKMITVVNKVDNEKRQQNIWEFYSYGLERIFPISAAHGLGCGELVDAILEFLPEKSARTEDSGARGIRLAVLGKPNTGKSTLLNTLTHSEQSIVSDIPGTTRDVIEGSFEYKNTHYTILDTAGIRRKSKVVDNVEYYSVNRAIGSINEADVVFLMIDAQEGLADQDKKIASLIVKKGKGIILVLNKWDLMKSVPNSLEAIKDRISFVFPVLDFAPVIPVSALEGEGIDTLLSAAYKVWTGLQKRIDTSALNNSLKKWLEINPPPRWHRGQYKIKYITQVSAQPVEFAVFVNRTKGFPASYIGYIKNKIRKEHGFEHVPLAIHVRG